MLLTDPWEKDTDRISSAKAAIQLLAVNLMPYTPSKIYVFTQAQLADRLRQEFSHESLNLTTINVDRLEVMELQGEHWRVPNIPGAVKRIWEGGWPGDYRLMGDWRLQHMPHVLRALGHDYVLQVDDDSMVLEPIATDLVQLFRTKRYVMGSRHMRVDGPLPSWGLAELARFFLISEKLVPTQLFQHCTPPDLSGLFTPNALPEEDISDAARTRLSGMGLAASGGFDGTVMIGNFMMMDLGFWFSPQVQRFVHLARMSGGSIRFRWNEQGVQSMVWLIFVKPERFYAFDFRYHHRLQPHLALRQGLPRSLSSGHRMPQS